jgi:putative addiction module component (TIGR02574 family)
LAWSKRSVLGRRISQVRTSRWSSMFRNFRRMMIFMSREVAELLKKALELPVTDRAELAGSILESLDQAEDKSVEDAWDAEILRRMENLDSGRIKPISHDEVLRRLASAIE